MAEPTCFSFPTEFPYELDDEFLVGLAQRLSWTSLSETQKSVSPCFNNPNKFECFRTGFDFECSSSQLKSPLMAVLAAENHASLKMSGEEIPYHNNGVRPSISVNSTSNLDYGLFSNQNCARNLAFQKQKVREDLVLQVLCASSWRRQAPPYRKPEIPVGARCGVSHSPWLPPPLNQQPQPNTSAVHCIHPGGSGVKRVSSGTGVFLPRRHLHPSDCGHKRGIPGNRFAEEIINPNQAPLNHCQLPGFDSISSGRNNPVLPMPRSFRAEVNQELHLPQEWTY